MHAMVCYEVYLLVMLVLQVLQQCLMCGEADHHLRQRCAITVFNNSFDIPAALHLLCVLTQPPFFAR
jgi:hypothetical protein